MEFSKEFRILVDEFYVAVLLKYINGNNTNAEKFIAEFDEKCPPFDTEFRNKLKRSFFMALK